VRHLEGIAVALALAACVYGVFWAFKALKELELRRHRRRIERFFEKRGEELVDARWKPFGPGAQSNHDVLFEVIYRDIEKREHRALCKVGVGGVYLSDDELTGD